MKSHTRYFLGTSAFALAFFISGHALASAPTVSIQSLSPSSAVDASTTVTFAVVSSGFTSPAYSFVDSSPSSGGTNGTIDQVGFFTWTPTVFDAGHHTLTVTVSDSLGDTASSSVAIFVRNNTIIVQGLSPGNIVVPGRAVSFTVAAPGFVGTVYGLYDSTIGSSLTASNLNSSGAFSWTPGVGDIGTHSLYITAYDSLGHNTSLTEAITVLSPSVSVTAAKPLTYLPVNTPMSFTATSILPKSSFSISDTFAGTTTMTSSAMNASTGVFTWTPAAADLGVHQVTVTAVDGVGNTASTSAQLIVVPATTVPAPSTITTTTSTITTGSPAVTTTSDGYVFTVLLAIGSRGTGVTELQKRLVALGLLGTAPTGYYGVLTSAAVKKFQLSHGLAQVGFVGPGTRAALNK